MLCTSQVWTQTTTREGKQVIFTTEKRRCEVEIQEGEGKEGAHWQGDELGADDDTNTEVDESDQQQ